jgi:hypothetical protein
MTDIATFRTPFGDVDGNGQIDGPEVAILAHARTFARRRETGDDVGESRVQHAAQWAGIASVT